MVLILDAEKRNKINDCINSPVRSIKARVEMYQDLEDGTSALVDTFAHDGDLISFKIDRAGDENKFFGFGIIQKITIRLRDINREKNITTSNYFKIYYEAGEEFAAHPYFYVSEVHRDEKTNELSITAYDALYQASKHAVDEVMINIAEGNTIIYNYIIAVAKVLKINYSLSFTDFGFDRITQTPNYEGTETIKDFLDDFAEMSGSVYFINSNNELVFEVLNQNKTAIPLTRDNTIDLDSKTNRKLSTIIHATELGENIGTVETSGTTQYIRDNAFFEVAEEEILVDILNRIVNNLNPISYNQFDCSWRGNPLSEPTDLLAIHTKDDVVTGFLINDTIEYDGTYSQQTQWNYTNEDTDESYNNPSTLGEALKQTFAKVDKVNHEIDLVVRTVAENDEANKSRMDEIEKEVALKLTQDDLKIEISNAIDSIEGITTKTGYTFNEDGLTVSKSDTDISTTITENGMKVSQGDNEKLVANADGVKAKDLKATTYLIIGNNSRFEDFTINGKARTACFWIGG